jgi:hypothetical protein
MPTHQHQLPSTEHGHAAAYLATAAQEQRLVGTVNHCTHARFEVRERLGICICFDSKDGARLANAKKPNLVNCSVALRAHIGPSTLFFKTLQAMLSNTLLCGISARVTRSSGEVEKFVLWARSRASGGSSTSPNVIGYLDSTRQQ